jgi:hypothetical protein
VVTPLLVSMMDHKQPIEFGEADPPIIR